MASIIKVDTIQTAAGGTPTAADLGINTTGNIIQGVHFQLGTGGVTYTNTSYSNTGIKATITPTSTSSKILVICSMRLDVVNSGARVFGTLYKNGSAFTSPGDLTDIYNGAGRIMMTETFQYYDSPNSTSALEYELYVKTYSGTANFYLGSGNHPGGAITLLEIAG